MLFTVVIVVTKLESFVFVCVFSRISSQGLNGICHVGMGLYDVGSLCNWFDFILTVIYGCYYYYY